MDEQSNQDSAVVFAWLGTLSVRGHALDVHNYCPIQGAQKLIADLRAQGHAVFIVTGAGYDDDMTSVGLENSEILFAGTFDKKSRIDDLRRRGFKKIVYVGDNDRDVADPALRDVPVILFDGNKQTRKSKIRQTKHFESMRKDTINLVPGADVSIAFGIKELEEIIDLSLLRAKLPTRNRTQIRSFQDELFANEIAKRFVEGLSQIVNVPILDHVQGSISSNIPEDDCVEISTSIFTNEKKLGYQITIDYPLDVAQQNILSLLIQINRDLRNQGLFGPLSGLHALTRYPDSSRPAPGLDLR